MFRFAIHMMIADIKRQLRKGAIIIVPIFLITSIVLPFIEDIQILSMSYFLVMMVAIFRPLMSKIYHTLPLTIKQIKMLLHLRVLIFAMLVIGMELLAVALMELTHYDFDVNGFLYGSFYITLYIMLSFSGMAGFQKDKKVFKWEYVPVWIITFGSLMFTFAGAEGWLMVPVRITISVAICIIAELYLVFLTRHYDFYDYTYVSNNIWSNSKIERA